jgi:hypothetical protein
MPSGEAKSSLFATVVRRIEKASNYSDINLGLGIVARTATRT